MENSVSARQGGAIDSYWYSAYAALVPLIVESDIVLLPLGSWPDFPCRLRFYDVSIKIEDATILILHKGKISAIPHEVLSDVDRHWQCVYANPVFVVFCSFRSTAIDLCKSVDPADCGAVREYLNPSVKRTRPGRIFFAHVPKTGGTSVWDALKAALPAHIYFADEALFKASSKKMLENYDLIGGHLFPSSIIDHLIEGDCIIAMIRAPEKRVVSNILHWRRPGADAATFSPEVRAICEMSVADILDSRHGRLITHLQLILLGTDGSKAIEDFSDEEMMENALRFVRRDDVFIGLSEQTETFIAHIAKVLSFTPSPLLRLNVSDRESMSSSILEFKQATGLIRSKTGPERKFYRQARNILVRRGAALGSAQRFKKYLATNFGR